VCVQDFKTFYDGKFGRKKAAAAAAAEAEAASDSQQNGQTTVVASNGNGHVNNSSDMAIYEQYRNQVLPFIFRFFLSYFLQYVNNEFVVM
jgi:katanin p60 ATPase-containing subunit A1